MLWNKIWHGINLNFILSPNVYFRKVNDIASASETKANSYVFFGHEDNLPGTIGIAWINSTCAGKSYRTSISEWFMNDAISAVVRRLFCYCPKNLHWIFLKICFSLDFMTLFFLF